MYTNFVSFSSFLTLTTFSLSLPHYHSLFLSPYLSSSLFLSLSAFQLSHTLCVSVSISLTYLYFPSCSLLPLTLLVSQLFLNFLLFFLFLQAFLRSSLFSFHSSSPSFVSSLIISLVLSYLFFSFLYFSLPQARTPLIISRKGPAPTDKYITCAQIALNLFEGRHFISVLFISYYSIILLHLMNIIIFDKYCYIYLMIVILII